MILSKWGRTTSAKASVATKFQSPGVLFKGPILTPFFLPMPFSHSSTLVATLVHPLDKLIGSCATPATPSSFVGPLPTQDVDAYGVGDHEHDTRSLVGIAGRVAKFESGGQIEHKYLAEIELYSSRPSI